MTHRITIQPSGHVFAVDDDETILEAALREGFVIAYGCRNGACGTCKGKVIGGTVDFKLHRRLLSRGANTFARTMLGLILPKCASCLPDSSWASWRG